MAAEQPPQPQGTPSFPEVPGARTTLAPSSSVWTRIKDHKIAQWTLAYAAAAYALLDGTKIVSEAFDWPHWLIRAVTVLLLLGVPLVVTLAWYHGHRALRRVSGAELTIITVLLVMAGSVLWHFAHAPQEPAASRATATAPTTVAATPAVAVSAKSIAVLPFVDMSEKHDQEYFSDGLSEELIDMLTKVPDLRVPARTSSFYFKGKQTTIKDIAAALGVAHVLEGSVRKSGNTLRITAQLIRADNGYHLWSETYDRELDDIFKVQDEIAIAVVKALKASLLAAEPRRAASEVNSNVYALLLQARFLMLRGSANDLARSIEYYQQAVRMDPTFAPAWAGLSRALAEMPSMRLAPTQAIYARSLSAAKRALALDPQLAEAHYAIGKISYNFDWNWPAAEAEFEKALALNPAGDNFLIRAADVARTLGKQTESLRLYEQAAAQDPLNYVAYERLGSVYYAIGRLSDAQAAVRKQLELHATPSGEHAWLGVLLVLQGASAAGLAEIRRETDEEARDFGLAWAYQVLGRRDDADSAFKHVEEKYSRTSAYAIASLHALRGERDSAFRWLERAYQQRDDDLKDIVADPHMAGLRGDSRYKALLHKLNLPE